MRGDGLLIVMQRVVLGAPDALKKTETNISGCLQLIVASLFSFNVGQSDKALQHVGYLPVDAGTLMKFTDLLSRAWRKIRLRHIRRNFYYVWWEEKCRHTLRDHIFHLFSTEVSWIYQQRRSFDASREGGKPTRERVREFGRRWAGLVISIRHRILWPW